MQKNIYIYICGKSGLGGYNGYNFYVEGKENRLFRNGHHLYTFHVNDIERIWFRSIYMKWLGPRRQTGLDSNNLFT